MWYFWYSLVGVGGGGGGSGASPKEIDKSCVSQHLPHLFLIPATPPPPPPTPKLKERRKKLEADSWTGLKLHTVLPVNFQDSVSDSVARSDLQRPCGDPSGQGKSCQVGRHLQLQGESAWCAMCTLDVHVGAELQIKILIWLEG